MYTPTFIIGTGRCGSTLLSNLIRQHPAICSLSEFFSLASDLGGRNPELFPAAPLSGEAFWEMIGRGYARTNLMIRHKVEMPEVIYPFDAPGARFTREGGVPLISQTTLPHLTEDCDALYDEVGAFVRALPEAPIRHHYDALFGWLRDRFGRKVWIERSGAIFNILGRIHETFPEARYIHIVRDGRNTALSMNDHRGFRMFVLGQFLADSLGVDPYYDDNRDKLKRLPRQYRAFLPECFDAQAFEAFRFPISLMGRLWSGQILQGLQILDTLPAERLLSIRYEDLVADPRQELHRLATFLGPDFVDEAWLAAATRLVRPARSQWEGLDEATRKALDAACGPGFDALAARGIPYTR